MIEVLAPAKLNLGLEILGRRDDGFHEIRTLMIPITLVDRLAISWSGHGHLAIGGLPVEASGNIVCDAISLAASAWGLGPVETTLTKRIPLAAGLGGGSSDAAATLLGLAHLSGRRSLSLETLAARLGSDVSFFLAGSGAVVSGRGEVVSALPGRTPLHGVVIVPSMKIARKTATMYARLAPEDFTDGSTVAAIATDLPGLSARSGVLPNAFRRPLYDLVPDLRGFACQIETASSLPANLTGAGPAHYVLCRDREHALATARRLRACFPEPAMSIFAVRSMTGIQIREVAIDDRDD